MAAPNTASVLALVAVVSFVIVLILIVCSCLLHYRRRRMESGREDDTIPILDETIERLHEIHQTRRRARRAREPPPSFEDAIINSRPISYIDVEEPPPSYEDYLKANSYFDCPPSVSPADIVIPLDIYSNSMEERESFV